MIESDWPSPAVSMRVSRCTPLIRCCSASGQSVSHPPRLPEREPTLEYASRTNRHSAPESMETPPPDCDQVSEPSTHASVAAVAASASPKRLLRRCSMESRSHQAPHRAMVPGEENAP